MKFSENLRRLSENQRTALLLAAIVLLAAVLRLAALNFDLPHVYHPDEDALVMPAMTILKSGDFQPTRMDYGSLFIYILAAVYLLVFIASARSGAIERVDALQIMERGAYPGIFPHPEYVLAARLVSAAFGIGIIVVVFMLGRRLGGTRIGLVAAGLAAVLPDLMIHSHYATTDTAATFMIVLSLYLLLRAYDHWSQDTLWAYAGAGFVCGLAVAAKYSNAFIALPLLLVPLLRVSSLDGFLRLRMLVGPMALIFGFLAGTPYALLNLPEFAYWTGYVLRVYNQPAYEAVGTTWQWQLTYLLGGRNALVVIPGFIGLILSLPRWGRRGWIMTSFVLIFLYTIFTQDARQTRSWLPLAPLFALYAALALHTLITWLTTRRNSQSPISQSLSLLLPTFLLIPLLWLSIAAVRNLAADDVRTVTQQWIEQNILPGTTLSFDRFPANVDPAQWPVVNVFGHYQHDIAWYEEQGVNYLFVGDVIHDPAVLSAEDTSRYQSLIAQLCPVETLSGSILATAGREIAIYKLPPC